MARDLLAGTPLAERYQVIREIGAGGMATVYLARDLKHDREVALKVLRQELTAVVGPERFLQEIRITAKLDHPHILTLIDSGETDHVLWYVLPYVRGESLRQKLAREGLLPVDEAVAITRRIAGALEYAHKQGVIHRDIKPENILLFEGEAMLADFGVALALKHAGGARLTESGLSLGTPQYMSPEQATGDRQLDARTDVYSLAAVLYEMLAGEPPHSGPSAQSVIAKLLTTPPTRLRIVRESVPPAIDDAVHKALAKLPVDRHTSAGHFAAALDVVTSDSTVEPGRGWSSLVPRTKRWAPLVLSAIGLVAIGSLVANRINKLWTRSTTNASARQVTFTGDIELVDISADGRFLAAASRQGNTRKLIVQDLLGGAPREIATFDWIGAIRWSPAGAHLAVSGMDSGRTVAYLVPFVGGAIRMLPGRNWIGADRNMTMSWSPDGTRLLISDGARPGLLDIVTVATGDTSSIRVRDPVFFAEWSPTGKLIAYVVEAGSPIRSVLRVIGSDGRGERIVVDDSVTLSSPVWAPSGDAVYYLRGGSEQRRIRVVRETGAPRDEPTTLRDGLQTFNRGNTAQFATQSITRDGRRMAYAKGFSWANLWRMGAANGSGRTQLTTGTAAKLGVAVSPDGKWLAYVQQGPIGGDVVKVPIEGGIPQQVTNTGRVRAGWLGTSVAWSPDGKQLAFSLTEAGGVRVATIRINGEGLRVYDNATNNNVMAHVEWTPGAHILHQREVARGGGYAILDPVTGEDRPLISRDTTWMSSAHYSPDARWIAAAWERPFGSDHRRSSADSARAPDAWSLGVWVLSTRDSTRRFLGEFWDWPIGWSDDGRSVYAVGTPERPSVIRSFPLNGGPARVVMELPSANCACAPLTGALRLTFICMVPEFRSDVWIIDNFDPANR